MQYDNNVREYDMNMYQCIITLEFMQPHGTRTTLKSINLLRKIQGLMISIEQMLAFLWLRIQELIIYINSISNFIGICVMRMFRSAHLHVRQNFQFWVFSVVVRQLFYLLLWYYRQYLALELQSNLLCSMNREAVIKKIPIN